MISMKADGERDVTDIASCTSSMRSTGLALCGTVRGTSLLQMSTHQDEATGIQARSLRRHHL